jgi:hypothetical protein
LFVDLRQDVEILEYFLFRFSSAPDRLVQMIERRRRVFGVELANKRNDFVDILAGDEASGEFFEKSKPGSEILEAFLAGQPNQRASGDHLWSVPVVSLAAPFSPNQGGAFARQQQIKELA